MVHGQYWQQQVNHTIDVTLDDKNHTLDGFERIEYINNSPDTLHFIWFHLWPNAYKNDRTAFSDQLLENGNTKFYFSGKEEKGYINRLDFKVNGITATVEDHPQHIDIVKILLPAPLAPGAKTLITTPFHVKLPFNFSRGGHDGQTYQLTQWYPKPAVYDRNGWHPIPYLDQGEFYSEFGDYDVRINVPEGYIVAATGERQEGEFKNQYRQSRVHDFAWFADKNFIVDKDTLALPSGRIINLASYYTPGHKEFWSTSIKTSKEAILFYSREVGEYPYNSLSVIQGPASFGGGMEYPTITVIAPTSGRRELDLTIAHEIGHNWFYGILASNERKHPWMDEGLNSFYDQKFAERYGPSTQEQRLLFETMATEKTDQPIATPSEEFSEMNYYLTAYYKTAEWMRYLESILGPDQFRRSMQEYYNRWKFAHPSPEDFKASLESASGRNLDSAFSWLNKKGLLPNQTRTGSKFVFAFDFKSLGEYVRNPYREMFIAGPLVGVNSYDKLMAGIFFTNIKPPPSRFSFFLAPMYATGSKDLTGLGFLYYNFYPNSFVRKVQLRLAGSSFNMDQLTTPADEKLYFRFQKLVPSVRVTFRNKNPRSHFNRFLQFKSFLVREDRLRIRRDSVITPIDTTVMTRYFTNENSRVLNQLRFVIENNRALYPFRGELQLEQGKDFLRTAFTGNYFFNYPKEGGFDVRLFAGKFIYTSAKTFAKQFATDRYHLNMTGPNGNEDYTYSDYFIGRNKFEGFTSQQIMNRDGAFKVRTELLADKIGKTDDWLIAANFTSAVPSQINPLSLLPVKIPLKLFLDIGTYAETWEQDAESDRFLYDAGIQVTFLRNTINLYIPLLYSKVYKDYIQ
jgi:hypothetical protein